ncbi:hypothetical protein [Streptomyces sp. NPDC088137]|uniref:hypothetical protein n=1 Tax=Streptomyces sp. NPDC088137 TaxID=3365827 RepID=UPI0038170FF4
MPVESLWAAAAGPAHLHCGPNSKFREHVNNLLFQDILGEEKRRKQLTDVDRRTLPPLFWTHVNPYGRFELDMNSRLDLDLTALAATVPAPRAPEEGPTTPAMGPCRLSSSAAWARFGPVLDRWAGSLGNGPLS